MAIAITINTKIIGTIRDALPLYMLIYYHFYAQKSNILLQRRVWIIREHITNTASWTSDIPRPAWHDMQMYVRNALPCRWSIVDTKVIGIRRCRDTRKSFENIQCVYPQFLRIIPTLTPASKKETRAPWRNTSSSTAL
jgi:hypothetical protein